MCSNNLRKKVPFCLTHQMAKAAVVVNPDLPLIVTYIHMEECFRKCSLDGKRRSYYLGKISQNGLGQACSFPEGGSFKSSKC